jgi:DNA binding domain, excisionase family
MNREAAAEYLDMSPGTLKNWVSRGLIEYVRIGRHVKFTRAGLDRYIARRTAVPRE